MVSYHGKAYSDYNQKLWLQIVGVCTKQPHTCILLSNKCVQSPPQLQQQACMYSIFMQSGVPIILKQKSGYMSSQARRKYYNNYFQTNR